MKEDTFTRLFNTYSQNEENWTIRYNEITQETTDRISEAKLSHQTAEEALEFIEVRKAIGDATEEEYKIKLPSIKWDLDHYDSVISEGSRKLAYLESLGDVLSSTELNELRGLASVQYNTLDALSVQSEELFTRIRESLIQSIKLLG
jgi:hypothetical protein